MPTLLGILSFLVASATPVPVILDTDLGDDIDDTWALCMLLGRPELDLKLIVTATEDTQARTRLAAKILDRAGRTDIPIGTGVKTGTRGITQRAWLGDYSLRTYPGTVHSDGVAAMIRTIHASPTPITIIVIGPQTNLREALRRDPSIAGKARVVAMAGSVHIGYQGESTPQPEWNVSRDIAAAKAVFAAPWEITFAPLDVGGTLILSGERYAAVKGSSSPLARTVIENYEQWAMRSQHPEGASSVLYDTVAVYLALSNDLCTMESIKMSINEKGGTVPDSEGRPVSCALGFKDRAAFEQFLVDSLTSPPKTPSIIITPGR